MWMNYLPELLLSPLIESLSLDFFSAGNSLVFSFSSTIGGGEHGTCHAFKFSQFILKGRIQNSKPWTIQSIGQNYE
jgi:hypothetical protein